MEIKIFGNKMRLELIALAIIIVIFISLNLICNCVGGIKNLFNVLMRFFMKLLKGNTETFTSNIPHSDLDYNMGDGIEVTYKNSTEVYNPFSNLENNITLPKSLSENNMNIFTGNKISSDCCPSQYSSKDGCLCVTPEQMKYLSQRGRNNKD
tara:strand:+ start:2654 stop:3109 length:456 start_codon:yes stop_codon:yes gene_type:complete